MELEKLADAAMGFGARFANVDTLNRGDNTMAVFAEFFSQDGLEAWIDYCADVNAEYIPTYSVEENFVILWLEA